MVRTPPTTSSDPLLFPKPVNGLRETLGFLLLMAALIAVGSLAGFVLRVTI